MSAPQHVQPPEPEAEDSRSSLRGTMLAVLLMAVFFVVCWLSLLAVLLVRR